MDNNNEMNLSEATEALCTAESAVESMDEMIKLFGVFDENLKVISAETGARIIAAGDCIRIEGSAEAAELAKTVVDKLLITVRRGENVDRSRIRYAVDLAKEGNADLITELESDVVAFTAKGRRIKCKTLGQKKYVNALKRNTVVFGVGPAGTGKTYLAVAMAVLAYKNKEVEKIILTRPAVEAGEKLGFLPGDLQNKVDPYLRPLYDALYDFLGPETFKNLSERGVIEVAPLAYMRGRTLNDAYIILDEAQNCTIEQMKMFLTRFGEGQASYYDCYKRGLREAVRLYQYFQIVRYQKESTERRKALKIINGVIKRNVVRAEQACDGLREYKHRRRYDNAHYYKHRQVLG